MLDKGIIEGLKKQINGDVVAPEELGYEENRAAFNLSVEQHPAVIVLPQDTGDISTAVQFAAQHNLGVAVQSTGHGVGRRPDDNMLIRTGRMTGVNVDAGNRTAYVESGAKWGQVLENTYENGLVPLLGSSPEVGVAGYTLGGGFGWLGRKYGLALDSVNYFDVVTADGQVRRASGSENQELFWAMRGGGGGFGVLAGMEIRLYPVETVYAGNLFYAPEDSREVFTRYREWIKDAPEELTSSMLIFNFPPKDFVPEMFRGKSFAIVRGCWCGEMTMGEQKLSYWREWKQPVHDFWGEIPFSKVGTISNDPEEPVPGFLTGAWMSDLGDDAIDTIIDFTLSKGGPPKLVFSEIRHAGGAVSRVDEHSNAYSNRASQLALSAVGLIPVPEARHALEAYLSTFLDDLGPHLTGKVYMNFLEGDWVEKRREDGFSADKLQRLGKIKAQYDPDNIFRFGFGIEPAG